jgi:hypothetical protein
MMMCGEISAFFCFVIQGIPGGDGYKDMEQQKTKYT